MQRFQMYIDGEFVDSSSAEWFDSYNPYTGDVWCQIAQGEAEDADRAVQAAHRAFSEGPWSKLTHSGRGALLYKLGDLIASEAGKMAETEVRDKGKLTADMGGQLNYIPHWFYYFGGLAAKIQELGRAHDCNQVTHEHLV